MPNKPFNPIARKTRSGLTAALCRDKRRDSIRCGVTETLGIVPTMQAIGMSPFVIAQHVSAATPNVPSSSTAAILQAQEFNTIRHAQHRTSAISTSGSRSDLQRGIRASFNIRLNPSRHRHITSA
jgi:hypothetical protein